MSSRCLVLAALIGLAALPARADIDLAGASNDALEAVAAGIPADPKTREATFLLAERLVAEARDGGRARPAVEAIDTATALYPDDPRLPALLYDQLDLHLEGGDPYAAHAVARRIMLEPPADPVWIARAAGTAATARDLRSAWEWSLLVETESVDGDARVELLKARVKSGAAVAQTKQALSAVRLLQDEAPEALHVDPEALLAAARLFESLGLIEEAVKLYERFVNVHTRHDDRAETLLELGRVQTRAGLLARAYRTFVWLEDRYPESNFSHESRLERIELEGMRADPSSIPAYVEAIRLAPDMRRARTTCVSLVERLVGGGHPREAAGAVINLVHVRDDDGIMPLAALSCLNETHGVIAELLTVRGDDVGVAAFALELDAADVLVDEATELRVVASRRRLGLAPVAEGPLEVAIAEARRRLAEEDEAAEVAAVLEHELIMALDAKAFSKVEAKAVIADALWRAGETERAMTAARSALREQRDSTQERTLRVLLADMLFVGGSRDEACEHYRAAAAALGSAWVDGQLARCEEKPS